ncbi:hypothetical protein M3P05_03670 [Sansalvadorimonas sp. 2012CJ34-2]|uniref:Uncharacterized protein n=1 Tax=Parendozoicomonas callyspongiae TaxID=2942213 RepID=A0ABT0PCU6_9GAMM|nr:hypothetical protein [Sansalvadorimonas sp. 2012CJ34-2]MCL6269041.1 hypothetical protein [Sansalvadorimonas sp. 2012CJ34-2]
MLATRNKTITMLRDLMAQEWVKVNAPEIIRALQDADYAMGNNIRIVLVVDGVPVHLAPPNPNDPVTADDLKMYQEYVQQSLAHYYSAPPPLDRMKREIEANNRKLKQLDGQLKPLGVNALKDVEDDMLKNNTVIVVDLSRRDSPDIWGENGGIPDSAIGRYKSSINGGNVHFIHNSEEYDDEGIDEFTRQQLKQADSWEQFDDEDDEPFNPDPVSIPLPRREPPPYRFPPSYDQHAQHLGGPFPPPKPSEGTDV